MVEVLYIEKFIIGAISINNMSTIINNCNFDLN